LIERSFARDEGPPFSGWLAIVSPRWDIPINAMLVSIIFTVILNLIAMGSNIAYNMLLTLNVSGLMTSYLICVACMSHGLFNFQGSNLTRSRYFLPPQLGRASAPVPLQPGQDRRQHHQRHFHVVLGPRLDFPIFPSCA
jgi:hypothetical protein